MFKLSHKTDQAIRSAFPGFYIIKELSVNLKQSFDNMGNVWDVEMRSVVWIWNLNLNFEVELCFGADGLLEECWSEKQWLLFPPHWENHPQQFVSFLLFAFALLCLCFHNYNWAIAWRLVGLARWSQGPKPNLPEISHFFARSFL